MTEGPAVSVIVPAYNAERTIAECLGALVRQTAPRADYEVIVVDDGSTDGTVEIARGFGVQVVSQMHAGPATARNRGASLARAPILLFTDADCAPADDWIARMIAPFHDPEIAGTKGAYQPHQQALFARFVQLEYEDRYDRMARDEYIDFIDTYAAGYRRDVFLTIGGFDPALPIAEDQEFSFRLARQGHKMVFVPGAQVRHLGHADRLSAYWRKKFQIGYWKVMVTRRHPDKLLRDSHTPQLLKGQILLVGLGGLSFLGSLLWPVLLWIGGALVFLFLLTAIPFAVKAWRRDPAVALISPGLLFVRALALGTGFAVGLVTAFSRSLARPVEGKPTR